MSPTFAYVGRTRAGRDVAGTHVADSVDAAVESLRRHRVHVTRIDVVRFRVGRATGPSGTPTSGKSLAVFTRQFAVMVRAGLPIVACLDILERGAEDPHFRETIHALRTRVAEGQSLAEAMREHPRAFDELFTSMIAAGEAGGVLDTILERLAVFTEKRVWLRAQLKSAVAYPAAVVSMAAVVVGAIVWKVVPTFASLFDGLGARLPWPTRAVLGASESLVTLAPVAALGMAGTWLGLRRYHQTFRGRRVLDGALLNLPVLGGVLRKIAVARCCRTLATLLGSGIPILEGLAIAARTAGNAVVEDAVVKTRDGVQSGASVADSLRRAAVFPVMVTHMAGVGEATGALAMMFSKSAEFYEAEVEAAVRSMLTLLEPVLVVALGLLVGGIVLTMYLPMVDLIGRVAS